MDFRFSVLMSVYIKENPEYFRECMKSILTQTLLPDEIVLVEDGPLTKELTAEIEAWKEKCNIPFQSVKLKRNKGLGLALAEGIKFCSYDLIARMDTDDICVPDRFEKQIQVFKENPDLDILGSHITEFEGHITNVLSVRKVPLKQEEIKKYQRRRSAFNHMTVMYKKKSVLKAGNYKNAPLMEDDLLWCEMLHTGAVGMNLDTSLVYARTGKAMVQRRGGWQYFCKYCRGRRRILNTGYITKIDYCITCLAQLIVSLMPLSLRSVFFSKMLRQ